MKSYSVKFKIKLLGNNYDSLSKGFFIKNNSELYFVTNTHSVPLDRRVPCEIYLDKETKIYGTIFKYPFFTDIVIIKPIDYDKKLIDHFNISKVTKLIHKEDKNLKIIIDDNEENIEFTSSVSTTISGLPFSPYSLLLEAKTQLKNDLHSLSGAPVVNSNNKIVGIIDKFHRSEGKLYIIPSFYIWKTLLFYRDDIIQNLELPVRIENLKTNKIKVIFEKPYFDNNFLSGDEISKIDGYNISNNLQIYDPTIGAYIHLSTYFLLKENGLIEIEIIRDKTVRKIKNLPLEDVNLQLPILINNHILVSNKNNIRITSGLLRLLKQLKLINNKTILKISSESIKSLRIKNGSVTLL